MIKGFNTHVSLSEIENRKSKIYVVCGVCVCVCAGVVGGGGGGANHTRSFSNVLYAKNSAIFAEKSALLKLLSFFQQKYYFN